ncbi:MAG: hypothetical protein HY237_13245 [Acidobacteria bacterium]|nr:hypothetical protein [Acidobacteriota bacterium]
MVARIRFSFAWLAVGVVSAGLLVQPAAQAQQDNRVPQTALSLCPALKVAAREEVLAGTAIAVSPDGRRLVQYVHTTRGAEIRLRERDTGEEHRVQLEPPALPPGVTWQVNEIAFSTSGNLLAVRSVGATWMLDAVTSAVRYLLAADAEKQTYPGKLSLAGDRLAVVFWPVESYLADAQASKPVAVRIYDAATGKALRTLALALDSSNQWTELALSPDASRLAVLLRPTRWPGKSRLLLFATEDAKRLWERKIGAEALAWSANGSELLVLGGRLSWLDAETGHTKREAQKNIRFSELQTLRASEPANLAVGQFARYNPFLRTLALGDRRDTRLVIWRMDTGKALCELGPRPAEGADVWPTARGELIALEESYDLRPPLRLLREATLVTYRLDLSAPAAPASPPGGPPPPATSSSPRP